MDLLTVKEAAELLGVSASTIRRYLKAGKFEGLQFGKDFKVNKASLENFINQSKIGGNDNDKQ